MLCPLRLRGEERGEKKNENIFREQAKQFQF